MFKDYENFKAIVISIVAVVETAIDNKKKFDKNFLKNVVVFQQSSGNSSAVNAFDIMAETFEDACKYAETSENNLSFEYSYSLLDENNFDSIKRFINAFVVEVQNGHAKCEVLNGRSSNEIKKIFEQCEQYHSAVVRLLKDAVRVSENSSDFAPFTERDIMNVKTSIDYMSKLNDANNSCCKLANQQ